LKSSGVTRKDLLVAGLELGDRQVMRQIHTPSYAVYLVFDPYRGKLWSCLNVFLLKELFGSECMLANERSNYVETKSSSAIRHGMGAGAIVPELWHAMNMPFVVRLLKIVVPHTFTRSEPYSINVFLLLDYLSLLPSVIDARLQSRKVNAHGSTNY